ncbi:MAG TPA: protein translocase subunit SecF [Rectinemataceae bacterium]|nr:protein translocase subunit SecF [Rectinemataceae bacterium]
MTRVINFDRSFKITVPISVVIILAGLLGVLFMGFRKGVDFQAGLNTSIQFAPPSMAVSYTGDGTMRLSVTKSEIDLISQAPSGDSKSYAFAFDKYATVQDIANALEAVPGIALDLRASGSTPSNLMMGASQTDSTLTTAPTILHYKSTDPNQLAVTVESIRAALKSFGSVSIQRAGDPANREFVIRIEDSGTDKGASQSIHTNLVTSLGAAFGADNVIVNSSQFVGARFSQTLARQAVWLTLLVFGVILLYCSFRFQPVYAIGAVLSVVHDALVLVAFIVFTRMEFNTTIIAAILTIVGYSINDTIVIYDRIREKVKLNPNAIFRENMNRGVTETLGRTFITSGTVLLSGIALFIFTTGSMKDFALCIIVGVTTGTYSSVFIASAFVDLWKTIEARREKARQAGAAALRASELAAKKAGR